MSQHQRLDQFQTVRGGESGALRFRLRSLVLPLLALVGCGWLLRSELAGLSLAELNASLAGHGGGVWVAAMLLGLVGLWSMGRMEGRLHAILATGVARPRARRTGMLAVAIGQALGLGALTGGAVRMRCLPECGIWTISKLSVALSLAFLAALTALTGLARLGMGVGWAGAVALPLLLTLALARLGPILPGPVPHRRLRGADLSALLLWTALDVAAFAGALWLFLPPGVAPVSLVLAVMTAMGVGLLSQSPGGLGAFELVLLALLPGVPEAELLAAVLATRIACQGVPALGAALLLLRRPAPARAPELTLTKPDSRLAAMAAPPEAGWGLAYQGGALALARCGTRGWHLRHAPGTLAALGAPLGTADFAGLQQLARHLGRRALAYDIDARTAAAARRAGWVVTPLSTRASLDPQEWRLDRPACRQLRRKLRGARNAGVVAELASYAPPFAEMGAVARAWALKSGRERGFSTGRYAPAFAARQVVILAHSGGRLVGFATFHAAPGSWSLELMRWLPEAPAGTMQTVLATAIEEARLAGIHHLSLANAPSRELRLLRFDLNRALGVSGLVQFKGAFGPDWTPRYAAAPSRPALLFGLAAAAHAIWRPDPLPAPFPFEVPAGACHSLGENPLTSRETFPWQTSSRPSSPAATGFWPTARRAPTSSTWGSKLAKPLSSGTKRIRSVFRRSI
ncbi:phosphatidylglycerol lysyltransferase domain-containing protein [Pseudoroseicyclus tamaricis]|uniref:DUF2156 domain-containing protein n=1 Tax=Pseudoroseicyclus tamaricis TaxID=2705421 RepID=A0A6B2JSQ1_9RHOB|nr:phosphatidylglycerol lysyltransferase domain-containing protein [Pseudoroseicyclus tamaricis]NDV01055.1 DUF2156 domain-containing protein [Pseudoroseicyclus tamaricis]